MTINDFKNKNVGFISLGCDKNRVDLEKIIYNISNFGMKIVSDPAIANIIIVNTCAFLESARSEAIENILEMANLKKSGTLEKLLVTGCINELNYSDLNESLPEVDAFVPIKDNDKIVETIAHLYNIDITSNYINNRIITTPNHFAYLKISEGCNNFCSYCLIPYIRGRYKSAPMEDLVSEARMLSEQGVTELILVAQDVTKYGADLYKEKKLVELIQHLSNIDKVKWIRLLYCYPEELDDNLIAEIKNNPKVVKYLDIPLQHVSTKILKSMNRRSSFDSICNLFTKLKSEIANIFIRSTFILGFPGETDDDVEMIAKFLKEYRLQHVGFFKYSREEGTKSYSFENQIDEDTKEKRLQYLSQVQYDIVEKNNQTMIGDIIDVIIDESYDEYSVGRTYGQAPLIDSLVYINEKLNIGKIYKIKITNKLDYDLEGERYESAK